MPAHLRGPGAIDYTGTDQHEEGQVNSPGLRLLLEVPCPWEPGDMTVRATITEKLLLSLFPGSLVLGLPVWAPP